MLVIREQQLQVFRSHLEEEFVLRLAGHLAVVFPIGAAAHGRQGVEDRARAAFRRAREFGLRRKAHVTCFADLDFALGADFEKAPGMEWALAVLEDPDLNPENKLYRLFRRCELRGIEIYGTEEARRAHAGSTR